MKAHFALLPEIALDAQELEELAMYLRSNRARFPCLVAAGLIHRPDGTGHHLNEAVLLSSAGDEILRSRKTEPFHNQTTGEFEDIVGAATAPYQYVDTPVGRLVVSICRDLRSDVQMVLNRAICASLVFVPAYSKRLDFVIEEARVLGQRQSAIVVAVNPSGGGLRDAFAAYAPVRGCAGIRIEQEHIQAGKDLVIALVKVQGAPGQLGEIRADTEMTV
jgi:predicted amidohydrolase